MTPSPDTGAENAPPLKPLPGFPPPDSAPGSKRWILPGALFVSVIVAFLDRQNISYALPKLGEDFGWSETEVAEKGGLLMGLFFIGYGISNIGLSPLAERFGARRSLLVSVVLFSLFTMLGAPLGFSILAFGATRVMLGLSEGVHFPMMSRLTKVWFPVTERSRAGGLYTAGILVSTAAAPMLLIPVIDLFGWRFMFVSLGVVGMLVTLPLVWLYVHDTPEESPHVTAEEAAWIEAGMERDEPDDPGYGFLRRPAFWLLQTAGMLNNFCAYGILSWMPVYFTRARGLPFADLKWAATAMYFSGMVGIALAAWFGDKLNRRALMAALGFWTAGLAVFFAARAGTLSVTVALMSVAVFSQAAFISQEYALVQRIVPRASIGKGTGLYNGIGILLGGGLGVPMIGQIISATGSYEAGIYVLSGGTVIAGTVLVILGRIIRY